ncbi:hypothetical protein LPJ64_003324 [Coemansia asiatica]|uniref:Uncharacterized protein n=1 Tax=Coemansia asiatica TaxID=1052880 RepID=A0A9W7XLD1_9FUNG|nr:hypothetical protein LPJ64_003324 [Coemansia asiatica]KAJ2888035.1 hypothetical protein FB639_000914 [Coemansia asiatica]
MGLQVFIARVKKALNKQKADTDNYYCGSNEAGSTTSSIAPPHSSSSSSRGSNSSLPLNPVMGTLPNSSETTLVDNTTYIGGHIVRSRNNQQSANQPRSQFTLGSTRVIVCR